VTDVVNTDRSRFDAQGDWHCLRGVVLGSLSLLRRRSEVGAVEAAEANEMANSALAVLHVQALAQRDRMVILNS